MSAVATGATPTAGPARRRLPRLPRLARSGVRRSPAAARKPSRPVSELAATTNSITAMVAIVCLWLVAQLLFLGALSESRAQDLLYGQLRTQLAGAVAPVGPVVPPGDPVALLEAPAIGLQQVVVEGTASGDLLAGPGHLRNTVLPGQQGVSVVMGHATTYGGPFGDLTRLHAGDRLTVTMAQGVVDYRVRAVRHAGDPLPPPPADGAGRLTLVTSEGRGRLAHLTSGQVVYVDADTTKAQPAPSGRPAAVPDSEKPMASDPQALPLLALCLGALVAMTIGVIAARQRWSTVLVWVVTAPLVLALSWATTDVVMRLLPNLV